MKYSIIIILISIFSSCGIIMINENSYRGLKEHDKAIINPFSEDAVFNYGVINTQFHVYEINTEDIKSVLTKQKYTWVHIWLPFCTSTSCQSLPYYSYLENEFKKDNLKLLLISETYDLNTIKNKVKESKFQEPIFVLQDAYYGHKVSKIRKKLFTELNNNDIKYQRYGFSDFLFKDTVLIYAGLDIDKHIIDSLIFN